MDLKNFLAGSEKEKDKEYFWSLVIEPGWVQAGIWDIEGDKAEVISISPTIAWEIDAELVTAADSALSAAIQSLPENMTEPTKTVFGVNASWVSEGEIKEEHLEKIRKLCSTLSLKPVGFVVLPEAISHLVKAEEGSPLNAIVLGVGKETLEIALFRLGNLVGTSQIARSVSIVDDVAEGLARFAGSEVFPSRVILYNGKEGELEDVRQSLINAGWETYEKIKFLHTPKIELVTPEKKVLAICLAGASEIANVTGVHTTKVIEGFEEAGGKEEIANIKLPEENINPEDLGFVVGKDVAIDKKEEAVPSIPQRLPTQDSRESQPQRQDILETSTSALPSRPPESTKIKLPSLTFVGKLLSKFPRPSLTFPGKRIIIFGIISFVVIFIFGFAAWWFLPTATVTVFVSPQKTQEKAQVLVDTKASSVNFSDKILPGKVLSTISEGDKTKSTTGTKTVGDKTKGSVKIQNGTLISISLPAGTLLLASNNFKFVTDTAVSVAAAVSPTLPGTANIDVTALEIGAEYNLAKNESFKVGNYPKAEVDATSANDFSGGSSRQISAVSSDDQANLEKELTEELIGKAVETLSGKVGENEVFIPETAESQVSDKTFSSQVGDEASTLKLSLVINVSGFSVSSVHLTDMAKEVLKNKVSSGYVLREGQISTTFDLLKKEDDKATLDVSFVANLLPETKPDEIAKAIKGKYPSLAEQYLTGIKGFSRAEIKIKPTLPGKLKTLPRLAKNIKIEVSAE